MVRGAPFASFTPKVLVFGSNSSVSPFGRVLVNVPGGGLLKKFCVPSTYCLAFLNSGNSPLCFCQCPNAFSMADLLFVEVHSAFFKASEENFFSRASNASLDSLPPAFSIAAAFPQALDKVHRRLSQHTLPRTPAQTTFLSGSQEKTHYSETEPLSGSNLKRFGFATGYFCRSASTVSGSRSAYLPCS